MQTVTVIPAILTENETTKLRCAAYCRVSSDSTDQINSFNAQVRFYSEIFNNSDTEILADVYADEGITGTRADKRLEFQRMMKDCRKGKIDRIYTKSISRFSRNTKDCLKSVRELKELGISIFFEKENIDTANTTDEMMITIMGGLAQEESTSISQNMRWSFQKRFEKGNVNAFSAPFGYKLQDGKLIPDDKQIGIVNEIFDMYLSGIGYQQISMICRQRYHEYSSQFSYYGIRYLLCNEKYVGNSTFQKSYTKDVFPFSKVENKGEKTKYIVDNTHTAIVDMERYEKVQNLINEKRHPSITKEYPLSRKLICGECGSVYKRKERQKCVYWVCRKHDMKSTLCSHRQINEEKIYNAFTVIFNKLKLSYKQILCPLADSLTKLKLKKLGGNMRVMDIHKETAGLRDQLHVLARLKTKGFLSDDKYIVQSKELEVKITKLQNELTKMSKADDEDDTTEQLDILISYLEKYEGEMVEFDEKAFSTMVDKIVVKDNTKLEFHLIGGLKLVEQI